MIKQGLGQGHPSTAQQSVADRGRKNWWRRGLALVGLVMLLWLGGPATAWAGLNDDNFDGNIFALYAGNGSLVPPKVSLEQSLKYNKPAIVVIYVDDSSDCKIFSSTISQLQAPYGRVANFIPVMADAIPVKAEYSLTNRGITSAMLCPKPWCLMLRASWCSTKRAWCPTRPLMT